MTPTHHDRVRRVALPTRHAFPGGPATFERHLVDGLAARGVDVVRDLDAPGIDVVLVVNAIRRVDRLARLRRRGVPIVQRLGTVLDPSELAIPRLADRVRMRLRTRLVALTRRRLADRIVYQTAAVQRRWRDAAGPSAHPEHVIPNGVDLGRFRPDGAATPRAFAITALSVEGAHGHDPCDTLVGLARALADRGANAEIVVVGRASPSVAERFRRTRGVRYLGVVPWEDLPAYYRGADVLAFTDRGAGCPNAVLEALACGTPVVGYRSDVLDEVIGDRGGVSVPSGPDGAPWDPGALADACLRLARDGPAARAAARSLANERYDRERMVDAYLAVFEEACARRVTAPGREAIA